MSDDPVEASQSEPSGIQQAGGTRPEPPSRKRDYPFATERHLADLMSQRDRLEATCLAHVSEVSRLSEQIISLTAQVTQRTEENRYLREALESERFQRGFIGIVATTMTAIGGGLVSVYSGWLQWAMGSLLFMGCAFMLYNSILNLSVEVRQYGVWGIMKQLWSGRQT